MDDQLNKEYDFGKINDLIYNMNKYQTILNSKEKDDADGIKKYQKKIQKCVSELEKLGIKMDPPKDDNQKGGSKYININMVKIDRLNDDITYELLKERIFMGGICK